MSLIIRSITKPSTKLVSTLTTYSSARLFHTGLSCYGRSVENRSILIQPITQQINVHSLEKSQTYKQLPDDSQFITQHYDELVKFKKYLKAKYNKTYKDYQQPNDLIMDLSTFIEYELKPGNWKFDLPYEIEVEFFMKLLHNLKICLKLNGGYTFILDVILANKECFEAVEKKKKDK